MNRAMKEKKGYWIGGTLTALLGVALVRLIAPQLDAMPGTATAAAGYALVIVGLTIIACGTRRKPSEAFTSLDRDGPPRRR
jgi:hypothetical protein